MKSPVGVPNSITWLREEGEKRIPTDIKDIRVSAGKPAITGGYIKILYGLYFAFLSSTLMLAANASPGGIEGVSYPISLIAFVTGGIYSHLVAVRTGSIPKKLGFSILGAILFWDFMKIALILPQFSFNYTPPGNLMAFDIGLAIYTIVNGVVLLRLQRRVSPDTDGEDSKQTKPKVHFNNSWRMFQTILSFAAALGVGILFPLGGLIVQRQNLVLAPLGWYTVGLFSSLVVLSTQLLYEMHFLEQTTKK